MFQAAIIGSSLLIALHTVAPNIVALTVLRGLGVAACGLAYPVTGAIVVEESPARYRGLFAGFLQTGYPIGWFLASLLAAPLLVRYGWRPMFLIGLMNIPYVFVIRRYLRESKRFEAVPSPWSPSGKSQIPNSKSQTNPKSKIQNPKFKGTRDPGTKVDQGTGDQSRLRELFAPHLLRRTLTLFFGQFLFVIAYGGSAFFFPTYFVEARNFDVGTATLLVGAANGIGAVGYVISSLVGEFFLTRRDTIVLWSWLGTLAFLWLIWGTASILSIIVVFGLMTMFFYGTAAVKFTFIAEHFPTRLRATGISFCSTLAVTLGIALGPLLVSTAVGVWGWNWAFTLGVAIPLLASGSVFLALNPIPSGVEVEEIAA
jgi:MFS family permease